LLPLYGERKISNNIEVVLYSTEHKTLSAVYCMNMFDLVLLLRTDGHGSVNDRSEAVINVIVPSMNAGSTTRNSHSVTAANAGHGQTDHSALGTTTRDHSNKLATEQLGSTRQHGAVSGQHSAVALGRDHRDQPAATEQHVSTRQQHSDKPFTEHRSDSGTLREHYDRLANERAHALAEASLLKA